MRIGFVFYWCVLAFHLCKGEDVERTESREGGRRQQWGPSVRSGSFVSESAIAASNEQSKYSWQPIGSLHAHDTCWCPSTGSLLSSKTSILTPILYCGCISLFLNHLWRLG